MEILIWGDDMRRQMSISFLCAILLIALAWLYIKFYNENQLQDREITTEISNEMEDATQTANDYITYQFYIKNEDGKVVVYTVNEQEKYMDTSIEIEALPMYLQEKITAGIFFNPANLLALKRLSPATIIYLSFLGTTNIG